MCRLKEWDSGKKVARAGFGVKKLEQSSEGKLFIVTIHSSPASAQEILFLLPFS